MLRFNTILSNWITQPQKVLKGAQRPVPHASAPLWETTIVPCFVSFQRCSGHMHTYIVFLIEGITHCKERGKEPPCREIVRFTHTHTFSSPSSWDSSNTHIQSCESPTSNPPTVFHGSQSTGQTLAWLPRSRVTWILPALSNHFLAVWSYLPCSSQTEVAGTSCWEPHSPSCPFYGTCRSVGILPFTSVCHFPSAHLPRASWAARPGKCPSPLLCTCMPVPTA